MPRGGQNKIPPVAHLLKGTFQPCRHGNRADAEAALEAARRAEAVREFEPLPDAPSWLPRAARAEWRRVARLLRDGLDARDYGALIAYVQAFARLREAEAIIERDGITVEVEGKVSRHPACGVQSSAWAALKAYALVLGLTPTARPRAVPAAPVVDPVDADFS
jgi:P27 family predicted phage terminase small subunit